jgi:hypothetical protein
MGGDGRRRCLWRGASRSEHDDIGKCRVQLLVNHTPAHQVNHGAAVTQAHGCVGQRPAEHAAASGPLSTRRPAATMSTFIGRPDPTSPMSIPHPPNRALKYAD